MIGCVTIDPNNPNTVWVGTGENVSGRHVAYGSGIYRSLDGGQNWKTWLERSERIGMIRIDPRDSKTSLLLRRPQILSGGGERGLFKSTDGGNPAQGSRDAVWATRRSTTATRAFPKSTWIPELDVDVGRILEDFNVAVLLDGGPGTGIHKSEDGGETCAN